MGLEHLEIGIRLEAVIPLDLDDDFWEVVFAELPPEARAESHSPPGTVGRVYEELQKRLSEVGRLGQGTSLWTRDQVWTITQSIISESLGVSLELVTPSSRLIQDLGMG